MLLRCNDRLSIFPEEMEKSEDALNDQEHIL
jgi:hypothetical protein